MSKLKIKPLKHYYNRLGHKVTIIEPINIYDFVIYNHTTGNGYVINQEGFMNADHSPNDYDIVKDWRQPKDFWIPIIQHENLTHKVNASQITFDTEQKARAYEPANPLFKTIDVIKYTLR